MGDSQLVLSCLTWLVVIVGLLAISPLNGGSNPVELPANPFASSSTSGTGASTANVIQKALCAIFLSPLSLIPVGGSSVCDNLHTAAAKVYDTVDHLVVAVVGFFTFLFQLNTFSVPRIPNLLQGLIVYPPEIVLGYIALKGVRGVGG